MLLHVFFLYNHHLAGIINFLAKCFFFLVSGFLLFIIKHQINLKMSRLKICANKQSISLKKTYLFLHKKR